MYSLLELSGQYARQAELLSRRLREVKRAAALSGDPDQAYELRRRAALLREMRRETSEVALLLAHYYDHSPSKRRAHAP